MSPDRELIRRDDPPRSLRRSISVSLAATYLPVAALISTCRILPSTEDVPRIIIGRKKRTYTHLQCVIIVTSRAMSDRALDCDQGQRIVKSQTSKGKRFSEVACLTIYYLFSRRRENPRRTREYHYFILKVAMAIDLVRFLSFSLLYSPIAIFLFSSLINSRYARISFVTPFSTRASYAMVCERRLFY